MSGCWLLSGGRTDDALSPGSWTWERGPRFPGSDPNHLELAQLVTRGPLLFGTLSLEGQVAVCPPNGRWEMLPPMVEPRRRFFGLCVLGPGLAAVGGFVVGERRCLRTVEYCLPSEGRWCSLPEMRQARGSPGVAVWGGRLVAAGGWDGQAYLDSVEAYDPDTNAWHPMPPLCFGRDVPAVIEFEGRLFVAAGYDGHRVVAAVEQYDPASDAWKVVCHAEGGCCAAVALLPRQLSACRDEPA